MTRIVRSLASRCVHDRVTIVTQNVDGLHTIAAKTRTTNTATTSDARCHSNSTDRSSPRAAPGVHGSATMTANHKRVDDGYVAALRAMRRPGATGVVWFGESLDAVTLDRAFTRGRSGGCVFGRRHQRRRAAGGEHCAGDAFRRRLRSSK
jgi:NAD-dependent SIR2 family protein deacetylase